MLSLLAILGCSQPCSDPLPLTAGLLDFFKRLDAEQCLHREDIPLLETKMTEYHKTTTLHCDAIWRRSSIDGKWFDGPEEKVLEAASVADIWIEPDGTHVLAFNDLRVGMLVEQALSDPQIFWRMGLVGYGGLWLAMDRMNLSFWTLT